MMIYAEAAEATLDWETYDIRLLKNYLRPEFY